MNCILSYLLFFRFSNHVPMDPQVFYGVLSTLIHSAPLHSLSSIISSLSSHSFTNRCFLAASQLWVLILGTYHLLDRPFRWIPSMLQSKVQNFGAGSSSSVHFFFDSVLSLTGAMSLTVILNPVFFHILLPLFTHQQISMCLSCARPGDMVVNTTEVISAFTNILFK